MFTSNFYYMNQFEVWGETKLLEDKTKIQMWLLSNALQKGMGKNKARPK